MTQTYFYRFTSESQALEHFSEISIDGRFELDGIATDVIGTIFKESGTLIESEDGDFFPEYVATPGFHINTTDTFETMVEFEVFPVTPYRVFM